MAKKQPLIDDTTMLKVKRSNTFTGDHLAERFNELAKAAKKSGAGCVSMAIRFDEEVDGIAREGEYIPELMLRVRKP
jgi:hypothetical protein